MSAKATVTAENELYLGPFLAKPFHRNRSFQGVLPLLKQSIYPAPDFQYPEQISCPGIIVVPHLNGNS
jgi:hypothetical protein